MILYYGTDSLCKVGMCQNVRQTLSRIVSGRTLIDFLLPWSDSGICGPVSHVACLSIKVDSSPPAFPVQWNGMDREAALEVVLAG
jgi:hypothetical protein